MKILFVTNDCAAGGAEEHLLDLSGRLCESGADLAVPVREEGVFKENVRRSGFPFRSASRFDISVSTHRNEGIGIVHVESLAGLAPVVAYNVGEYLETPGQGGGVFVDGGREELPKAVVGLIRDHGERRRPALPWRNVAEESCSPERMGSDHFESHRSLVAG